MKTIKRYILIWALLIPLFTQAQNIKIARFEIREQGKKDYLLIHFSNQAMQMVMANDVKTSQVIDYFKTNTDIHANGERLIFGTGKVWYGQQSMVQLEVQNLPEEIQSLDARILSFHEIIDQENILVLNARNQHYRMSLQAKNHFEMSFQKYYYINQIPPNIRFLLVWVAMIMMAVVLASSYSFFTKPQELT